MEPTEKAREVNAVADAFLPVGSKGRVASIRANVCAWCGTSVSEESFRDPVSLKEYTISGMCQQCQDSTFGPSEIEEHSGSIVDWGEEEEDGRDEHDPTL